MVEKTGDGEYIQLGDFRVTGPDAERIAGALRGAPGAKEGASEAKYCPACGHANYNGHAKDCPSPRGFSDTAEELATRIVSAREEQIHGVCPSPYVAPDLELLGMAIERRLLDAALAFFDCEDAQTSDAELAGTNSPSAPAEFMNFMDAGREYRKIFAAPISLPPVSVEAREVEAPHSALGEAARTELLARFSDRMSMQETADAAYAIARRFLGLAQELAPGDPPSPSEEFLADLVAVDDLIKARAEVARLTALINTPEIIDFVKAVQIEAVHQRERWGTEQDEGKTAADWFWLLGYLAGKALHSDKVGDRDKLLHHIITTAAACANWHAQVLGKCDMRPGIATPEGEAKS